MSSRASPEKTHLGTNSHSHVFPYLPLTPTSNSTTTPFMLVPLMTNPNANPETYNVSAPASTLKPLEPIPEPLNPITSSTQSLKPGEIRRSVVTFSTSLHSNPIDEVLQYHKSPPTSTSNRFKTTRAMHKITQSYDLKGNPTDKNFIFPNTQELNEVQKSSLSKLTGSHASSMDFTALPKYNQATEFRSPQTTINELDNLKKENRIGSTVTQTPVTGSGDPFLDEIMRKYGSGTTGTGAGDRNSQIPPSYKNDFTEPNKRSQYATPNQVNFSTSLLKTAPISKNDVHSIHFGGEKKSLSHDFSAGFGQPIQNVQKVTHTHSHSSSGINFKFSNLTISVVDNNSPDRQGGIENIIVNDTHEKTPVLRKEISFGVQPHDHIDKENLRSPLNISGGFKDVGHSRIENKFYKENLADLYSRKTPENSLNQLSSQYVYNASIPDQAGVYSKGDHHYSNKSDVAYSQTNWSQQSNYDYGKITNPVEMPLEREYKASVNGDHLRLNNEKRNEQHHGEGLSHIDKKTHQLPNKVREVAQPKQVTSHSDHSKEVSKVEEHSKHKDHDKIVKAENKVVETLSKGKETIETKKIGKSSHILVYGVIVGLIIMILSWLFLIIVEEPQEEI